MFTASGAFYNDLGLNDATAGVYDSYESPPLPQKPFVPGPAPKGVLSRYEGPSGGRYEP